LTTMELGAKILTMKIATTAEAHHRKADIITRTSFGAQHGGRIAGVS
jgi:hypothetical protein